MITLHDIVRSCGVFALVSGMGGAALAGDLNPQVGPVAPTMKTLDEAEPRTAINAANTPGDANSVFRITQSGSYYLTSNVTGEAGKHGIEIDSTDVSIDLNGFHLQGVFGSLDGIFADGRPNISIRNGSVLNWGGNGIHLAGGTGSNTILVESIRAFSNGEAGIYAGSSCVVRNCTATGNGTDGVVAYFCAISNCAANENEGIGIRVGAGASVENCISRANGGGGFLCEFFGGTIENCMAENNSVFGFDLGMGTSLIHCTARTNNGHGIRVSSECLVLENNCADSNGGPGAAAMLVTGNDNRIEGNTITNNSTGRGLDVDGTGNLIIRNSARGNSTNYDIVAGNTAGPIVTSATIATSSNPHANYSF